MPGDKSGTITLQNQCVGAKAVLRGKSIAIKAYLILKKSQVSNLILHLKEQEKEEEKNCLSQQKERNCKDQSRNK